jgi:hypothetical protein
MKKSYVLAFSILSLVAVFSGAVVVSAETTAPVGELQQTVGIKSKILQTLNAPPAFSDSTLRRPL